MDIRQLRYFTAIADEGSISRAAVRLGVAQPAISRSVAALEASVGVPLLIRHSRGVRLTPAGDSLLGHAETVIGALAEAERDLAALRTAPGGMVSIGMTPALAASLGPRLVGKFQRRHPDVLVRMVEGFGAHLREQLAKGAVHAVLMYNAPKLKEFHTEDLFSADDHLVGPKGAAAVAGETIPFAALEGLPLTLSRPDNATRRRFDRVCRQVGMTPRILVETDSPVSMRALVLEQGMFTLLPYSTLQTDVKAGVVDSARVVRPTLPSLLSLTTAPWMPLSDAARHLVEMARRELRAMARERGWPIAGTAA